MEIKLYRSPLKAIRLIFLSSLFVIPSLLGIVSGSIAIISICFFGLGYPIGIYYLLDRRPQIIFNEFGVFDRTVNKEFINWDIIHDAYRVNIYKQKFICLIVEEQFRPSKKKGKFYQQIVKLNEALGTQELNLNLGQVNADADKLVEFILLMRNATKLEKENIINQFLIDKIN